MFVVRVMEEGQEPDFKAFGDQSSAQARFDEFSWRTLWDEEFESVTLFDVSGTTDAGEAIDAIKRGDRSCVTLLLIAEPMSVAIANANRDENVA